MKCNASTNLSENESEWNALMLASRNEHRENVEMLLKNRCDVNYFSSNGTTSLMIACENGNIEIVDLLLSYNADIKIKDQKGWTAKTIGKYL